MNEKTLFLIAAVRLLTAQMFEPSGRVYSLRVTQADNPQLVETTQQMWRRQNPEASGADNPDVRRS
jgi:hypothetical protein